MLYIIFIPYLIRYAYRVAMDQYLWTLRLEIKQRKIRAFTGSKWLTKQIRHRNPNARMWSHVQKFLLWLQEIAPTRWLILNIVTVNANIQPGNYIYIHILTILYTGSGWGLIWEVEAGRRDRRISRAFDRAWIRRTLADLRQSSSCGEMTLLELFLDV